MKITSRGWCDEPGRYSVCFPSVGGIYYIDAENGMAAVRIAKAELKDACRGGSGGSMDGLSLAGRMNHATVCRVDEQTPEKRKERYDAAVARYHSALETARVNRTETNIAECDRLQRALHKEHERWLERLIATTPESEW